MRYMDIQDCWTNRMRNYTSLCEPKKPRENAGNNSKMDDRYAKRMHSSKEFELTMKTS